MTDQRVASEAASAPDTITVTVTTLYGDRVALTVPRNMNVGELKAQAVLKFGLDSSAAAHSRLRLPASTSLSAAENMMDGVGLDYYGIEDGRLIELVGYGSDSSDDYKKSPWMV